MIGEGDRARVLLAKAPTVDPTVTADGVRRALEATGARGLHVAVDLVESIPRVALGKAPLIRRAGPGTV